MIHALKGKIFSKKSTELVLNVNNVFYLLNVSINTIEKLPNEGEEAFLFTIFIVREDSQSLYGFVDEKEKSLFKLLIEIKNIGPKTALGILSSVKADDLYNYISNGNTAMLAKLPGIGKKTAERLHIELKDKIDKFADVAEIIPSETSNLNEEAVSALVTLGFNRSVAQKAVSRSIQELGNDADVEKAIKMALKIVMK